MDHHHYHPNNNQHHDNDAATTIKLCATASFAFLREWMILIATCSLALLFFPLAPSFTLHSTSSSSALLNNNASTIHDSLTANFRVSLLIDESNPVGSQIHYDVLHLSLFHRQKHLSTLSLQEPQPAKNSIEAKFDNVSVGIDEWGGDAHGINSNCGFVYLEVWFMARARYAQAVWDKLSGRCGEAKVEICSSERTGTTTSFLASCDVYSEVVYKVRLVLLVVLMLLVVTAVAVPFLIEQFFCSNS